MNLILMAMTILASSVPVNMELAEEALILACEPVADSVAASGVNSLAIEIEGDHLGGWFVRQTLVSVLDQRDIEVLDIPVERSEETAATVTLKVRPMELIVDYGDVSRPWIVGARRVERFARCELSSTLIDEDHRVLLTLRSGGEVSDVVSWSDTEELNGSEDWVWLSSPLPEDQGGGILEPIIVTGVVASLVYLFYSSRAN